VIDASEAAREVGLRGRTNTILQTCFFALSGVLPRAEAIWQIKAAIRKTYADKGEDVVERNFRAVDGTLERLHAVEVPSAVTSDWDRAPLVPEHAPEFVRAVTARMLEGCGDEIPVSLMPADGLPARRFTKSAMSPMSSRSGSPTSVCSAGNAALSARIP
jgi:pyruvate-ferredoxin/flavodoxin oxidoreductase